MVFGYIVFIIKIVSGLLIIIFIVFVKNIISVFGLRLRIVFKLILIVSNIK